MDYSGKEKRRFPRGDAHFKIFYFTQDARILSAYTENVSDGGLKAVFDEELPISSIIRLEIFVSRDHLICKGKVAWVKKQESRTQANAFFYETGIEFLRR